MPACRASSVDCSDDARRRAADVERPHRQLRARLADRLRRDDADRLAELDHLAGREVAAVALRAARRGATRRSAPSGSSPSRCRRPESPTPCSSSISSLTSTITSPVNGSVIFSSVTRPMMRSRSGSMISPALDDGAGFDAVDRAAVDLVDDHVLRDVDETARQVARVGRLERRVGQALARAVRRDEVLQHRRGLHGSST